MFTGAFVFFILGILGLFALLEAISKEGVKAPTTITRHSVLGYGGTLAIIIAICGMIASVIWGLVQLCAR
jgi:hypothetical protein